MSRIQIKQQSFPKRCEICHQTDLFDAEKNFCSRCVLVKDINVRAYEPSNTRVYNPASIMVNGNVELMSMIQIGSILCALAGVFIDIKTILLSGPILSSIGIVIAWSSYRCRTKLGILWGLSALVITLFCLSLIAVFNWSPKEATFPIRIIAVIYTIIILPIGITILLHFNRRNPKGTFSLKVKGNVSSLENRSSQDEKSNL